MSIRITFIVCFSLIYRVKDQPLREMDVMIACFDNNIARCNKA